MGVREGGKRAEFVDHVDAIEVSKEASGWPDTSCMHARTT